MNGYRFLVREQGSGNERAIDPRTTPVCVVWNGHRVGATYPERSRSRRAASAQMTADWISDECISIGGSEMLRNGDWAKIGRLIWVVDPDTRVATACEVLSY